MIWLQLTANTGPADCCWAAKGMLDRLLGDAREHTVDVRMIDSVDGPAAGTLRSILLELAGEAAPLLAQRWSGSLLWICDSPYRPGHRRKNWFVGGAAFAPPAAPADSEIRYEATRASGPGGQHVNKTDSAIRATHLASGLSVKVQTERSQHANKRLAGQLLASKLAALADNVQAQGKAQRHLHHQQAERGNPQRTFVGLKFTERRD